MANVLFKKGLLSQLPTSGSNDVVDGALYFAINTADTNNQRGKLYLGDENHKLIPIGEDIILKTVANMEALPSASQHDDEFYYIQSANILAHSDGHEWHQVNTDTKLVGTSAALSVGAVSNNVSEVSLAIAQTDDPQNTAVGGSFGIKGGTNVTITKDGNNVVITSQDDDTHYGISAAAGTPITESGKTRDIAEITLTSTDTNDNSVVKFKDSDSVGVSVDANGIISFAVDTSGVGAVTDLTGDNGQKADDGTATSTNGFSMLLQTSDLNHPSFAGNIDPQISLKNSSGTALSAIHFVSGVAALDAYSTGAVDEKLANLRQTIDAMTYKGGAQTLNAIKTNGLHNGDVYLATGTIDFSDESVSTGSETVAQPGYLIIVEGTENTANNTPVNGTPAGEIPPANATYTVVKAHDTDTTYSISTVSHGINLVSGGNAQGGIVLAAGSSGLITLTDSVASNVNTITIEHNTVTRQDPALDTSNNGVQSGGAPLTFNIVSGITSDASGHITAVATKQIQVVDTHLNAGSWATTSSVATSNGVETATVTQTNSGDLGATGFKLASSSLDLATTGGDTVSIDLVWGTFGTQS